MPPPKSPHTTLPRRRLIPVQVFPAVDFTGGLNLQADAFSLADNESPDLLNVDPGMRGGFRMRNGVVNMAALVSSKTPRAIFKWASPGSPDQILVQDSSGVIEKSTGGAWASLTYNGGGVWPSITGLMRGANMNGLCVIQWNAEQVASKYDGLGNVVPLGTSFNDNLASPTSTNAPKAKYVVAHGGYMWVANTNEGGTAFPNRVRWSHPGHPCDYRTLDFIDIDVGNDGDQITGLLPLQDRLLVFKQNHTYAITGFDPSTFSVVAVSHEVGAVSQDAVCADENVAYFFSWPQGVMKYDTKTLVNIFYPLRPLIDIATIQASNMTSIYLGWLNNRLWVGVPLGASSTPSATFVFDPRLGKNGAWTKYDIPTGPCLEWRQAGSVTTCLVCVLGGFVVKVDNPSTATDNYGAGAVNIASHARTSWFDMHSPSVIKKWRRPDFVFDADNTGQFLIDVFADYDPTTVVRSFALSTSALSTSLVWDDGTHASNMKWNQAAWSGAASSGRQIVERGQQLISRARSVQLRVTALTAPSAPWALNTISLKYKSRPVR